MVRMKFTNILKLLTVSFAITSAQAATASSIVPVAISAHDSAVAGNGEIVITNYCVENETTQLQEPVYLQNNVFGHALQSIFLGDQSLKFSEEEKRIWEENAAIIMKGLEERLIAEFSEKCKCLGPVVAIIADSCDLFRKLYLNYQQIEILIKDEIDKIKTENIAENTTEEIVEQENLLQVHNKFAYVPESSIVDPVKEEEKNRILADYSLDEDLLFYLMSDAERNHVISKIIKREKRWRGNKDLVSKINEYSHEEMLHRLSRGASNEVESDVVYEKYHMFSHWYNDLYKNAAFDALSIDKRKEIVTYGYDLYAKRVFECCGDSFIHLFFENSIRHRISDEIFSMLARSSEPESFQEQIWHLFAKMTTDERKV